MIHLKQGIGEHFAGKTKTAGKEIVVSMPTVNESGKRAKRSGQSSRAVQTAVPRSSGLSVPRVFSRADVKPFDQLEWEHRTAEITDEAGKVIFKQENVEVPKSWSILATKVVVSKYFYGENGTPEREQSARQLIHRVARTIANWGKADGKRQGCGDVLRRTDLALCQSVWLVQFARMV